ncbi:MAG: hypothetical protein ACLQIB_03135 [Isosphaeraceae bacterium]
MAAWTVKPRFTDAECQELGHLDYLHARLAELRDRGLLAEDVFTTIAADSQQRRQAIDRNGRFRAAMRLVEAHKDKDPKAALVWAERALELDPSSIEAWKLVIRLNWDLENEDEALARCAQAAHLFPELETERGRLEALRQERARAQLLAAEQARAEQARLEAQREERALAQRLAAEQARAEQARLEAQRQERALAQRLAAEQAHDQHDVSSGMAQEDTFPPVYAEAPLLLMSAKGIDQPPPRFSWASVAREFLEEHWQKLLLCLAVLLIVVSSTVGADLLLGGLLSAPASICALALVYTSTFAALGAALARWGATRAGQMMLITTLAVVPIHFMLAGELKLLADASFWNLGVLLLDGLGLWVLAGGVSRLLLPRAQARFLAAALLFLSAGSALAGRGSPLPWGWQFAAFQVPALVFLGAVWALGARSWGGAPEEKRQFAYLVWGLLGFALLACLIRTGVYALGLEPALYAVPLMLGALACVLAARRMAPFDPDPRHLAYLRYGGYVLSGISFAVALARPPFSSALFSTNLTAAGLLGLVLYVASLQTFRHPAFLYLALGAAATVRVGAHYFVAERLRVLEGLAGRLLGYPQILPHPFRAVLAWPLSVFLAGLALWFARHWNDRRLARHCHFIGLPLAIGACVLSGFEPLAATICLAGYALLSGIAVWLFSAAWLTYFVVACLAGSAYFGSTLVPGMTWAGQALLAAGMGFGCWATRLLLRRLGAAEAYRAPWLHAALALKMTALAAATYHVASSGPSSPTALGAFGLVTVLAVLLNREWPRTIWAYVALVSFLEFTICGMELAAGGPRLPAHDYGLLLVLDGLAAATLALPLSNLSRRHASQPLSSQGEQTADTYWAIPFLQAIPRFVIVVTFLADSFALFDLTRTWHAGLVFLIGCVCLLGTTRLLRRQPLVYLGLAHLVAGVLVLVYWAIPSRDQGLILAWLALASVLLALAVWAAGSGLGKLAAALGGRFGLAEFYAQPALVTAWFLTAGVFVLAIEARVLSRESYRPGALALALDVVATMLLARSWRVAAPAYAAVLHFVAATYVVLLSAGTNDPRTASTLGLCAVLDALIVCATGFLCLRARDEWARACALPLFHSALMLAPLADALALVDLTRTWHAGLVFLIGCVCLLGTTRLLRRQPLVYLSFAHLVAGALVLVYWAIPSRDQGLILAWLALVSVLLALALWAAGSGLGKLAVALGGRFGLAEFYAQPALVTAWALTAGVFALAIEARVLSRDSYQLGALALALDVVATMLLARSWRVAVPTYAAVLHFVAATYVVLLSAGTNDPRMASTLGLCAILDALIVCATGFLCLRARDEWARACALPLFHSALLLAPAADALALVDLTRTWHAGLVFLIGCVCLLGTTRLLRRQPLVYLSFAHLVAGALVLVYWAIPSRDQGLILAWLALASVLLALALWAAGSGLGKLAATFGGRFGLAEFYARPALVTAWFLTAGVFVLAIEARVLSRDSYQLGALALALDVVATMLLARSWRVAVPTYAAVLHFVAATYVVLLSAGTNDPRMAFTLGLCAVIDALLVWAAGFLCLRSRDEALAENHGRLSLRETTFVRRAKDDYFAKLFASRSDWAPACAPPLFHWALFLTALAILLCDRSPLVLLLIGASFLLTVKSLPRAEWLYGTIAAWLAACYFRWLAGPLRIELAGWAMLCAFVVWAIGMLVQRCKPALGRRLALRPLDYEFPFVHSSMLLGLIALAIRVELTVEAAVSWRACVWLPLCLALLALLMLRPYPHRNWLHLSLAFLAWSVVVLIVPSLTAVCFLALAGMVLALGLLLAERAIRPVQPALCARLGVKEAGYLAVVQGWSSALFGLGCCAALTIVIAEVCGSILGQDTLRLHLAARDWWAMLATLGLLGGFLGAKATDPEGWGRAASELTAASLHWLGIAIAWWLGVGCSPLVAAGLLAPADYLPLVTAAAAVATVQLLRRYLGGESSSEPAWLGAVRCERLRGILSAQAFVLAAVAIVFTRGAVEPTTVLTLALASVALGSMALAVSSLAAAVTASVAWAAAGGMAGLVVARRQDWFAFEPRAASAAAGLIASAFTLWAVAGWLRRDSTIVNGKGRAAGGSEATAGPLLPLALAGEWVALLASLASSALVFTAAANPASLGDTGTFVGIGVLMAAALLDLALVPRWQAEWLVYLAQVVMLGAYIDYRMAFPLPKATDAAVLTLLAYLDLSIAEAMQRLQRTLLARPLRNFSLVLPLLPLLEFLRIKGLDELSLFHLAAGATFYGVACAQLRWKPLGYGAAVLYNAALWVLWSRIGWRVADHPQFFLVPVGLSAILFAEVNRRELGRQPVNTIRSVGLLIIYVSLAVPIWQFQSLGAWVAFLICALASIFVGIGLRLQTFVWMGVASFVMDLAYEMARVSVDYAFAKWLIMLVTGCALFFFVALNEKKRIVATLQGYYEQVRQWE